MSGQSPTVWHAWSPSEWPKAPRWMSFSTLLEVEACPRRWALCAADYPYVWERPGYPRTPQTSTLEGTVVHLALEKISHALAKRGCQSLTDESAFCTLKDLGGYTVIIANCIDCALRPYKGNPRATPVLDEVRQQLERQSPKLRTRIQRLLSRIHLVSRNDVQLDTAAHHIEVSGHQLPHGSHAEVKLQVPDLGWQGVADFLTLSSASCEIRDFKTGISKPQHEFQLRTYALLWARDLNLNPSGRLADKLVLSYDDSDVEVPPPREKELRFLENEVRRRTAAVCADLRINPPETRPSQQTCPHCIVRHLCEEYWQWHARQREDSEPSGVQFTDLQIKLSARHGPASWDSIVESSSHTNVDQPILLRTSNIPFDLHPGQRIRLLNIHVSISKEECLEEEPPQVVATMGVSTEIFLIPR